MKQALEYMILFVWVLVTIMTCAAVWNVVKAATIIIAAILLFGFNAVAIYKAARKISKLDK